MSWGWAGGAGGDWSQLGVDSTVCLRRRREAPRDVGECQVGPSPPRKKTRAHGRLRSHVRVGGDATVSSKRRRAVDHSRWVVGGCVVSMWPIAGRQALSTLKTTVNPCVLTRTLMSVGSVHPGDPFRVDHTSTGAQAIPTVSTVQSRPGRGGFTPVGLCFSPTSSAACRLPFVRQPPGAVLRGDRLGSSSYPDCYLDHAHHTH